MGEPLIQNSFVSGELSPSLWGRTDLDKYHSAAAVMRNMFVDYRSGATSRPGTAFVGFAGGQGPGTQTPPRLIPFQYSATETYVIEMGPGYFRFIFQGAYVTEAAETISAISIGSDTTMSVAGNGYNAGDLIFVGDVVGVDYPGTSNSAMSNRFFYVSGGGSSFGLINALTGAVIATTGLSAFVSGTVARVYTVPSPYAAADLRRIKYCQSGDTMTLTHVSYPAANLVRVTPSTWSYTPITFAAVIQPPTNLQLDAVGNGDGEGYAYHYTVTSVNDVSKEESTQSANVGVVSLALNTTSSQGTVPVNILTWNAAVGATRYNVYKQPVSVGNDATNNVLTLWGYAGQSQSTTWADANYAPDFSQSPPIHYNPFQGSGFGSVTPAASPSYQFLYINPINSDAGAVVCVPPPAGELPNYLIELPNSTTPALPGYYRLPAVSLNEYAPNPGGSYPVFSLVSLVDQPVTVEITAPGDGFTNVSSVPLSVYDASPANSGGNGVGSGLVLIAPKLTFGNLASPQLDLASFESAISAGGSGYLPQYVLINPQNAANAQFDATAAINAALAMPNAATLFPSSATGIPLGTSSVGPPYPACYINGSVEFDIYNNSNLATKACTVTANFVILDGVVTGLDNIVADTPGNIDPNGYSVLTTLTVDPKYSNPPQTQFTGTIANATNYPGVCCYFQQRQVFAGTANEPQAVYMTKPGLFNNMDYSVPSEPDDSVNITINAQDLSIIQSATPMPSGLILLTGEGAWQITGGGLFQPVTPSTVNAQPQAFSGASYLQPLRINYDLLYVQARGYAVRRLQYNFYFNVYAGTDISVLSAHLFEGRQLVEWCYAEQPFYLVWALREDGVLLTLTYLAEQAVEGWARHDTQGQFVSVCSVPEGSEDAVYAVVRRSTVINGAPSYFYATERFASRLLGGNLAQAVPGDVENAWCVDCGVRVAPAAGVGNLFVTLTGEGALADVAVVLGGANYPASVIATVIDQTGAGSGAAVVVTIDGGVVTGIAVTAAGSGYVAPVIVLAPSTGSGAVFQAFAQSTCTLVSDQGAFALVGQVVRASGGKAVITSVVNANTAQATIATPFTAFVPSTSQVAPAFAGTWTLGTSVSVVTGLQHLEGQTVTGLADGVPIPPAVVVNASITLATAASLVTVGLPYTCQLQTLPIDVPGQGTVQGKRKMLSAATLRVVETEGLTVGSSWARMTPIKQVGFDNQGPQFATGGGVQAAAFNGVYGQNPVRYVDERIILGPNWGPNGQICVQQSNPLPASVVAIIPEMTMGDVPA